MCMRVCITPPMGGSWIMEESKEGVEYNSSEENRGRFFWATVGLDLEHYLQPI